jgi:hypothetical protein
MSVTTASSHVNSSLKTLTKLSGLQWSFVIVVSAIAFVVLVANVIIRNATRWRAVSNFKQDIVSDDFLTLRDLPRVSHVQILSSASPSFPSGPQRKKKPF